MLNLIILTEGSPQMGTGHIIRCSSISQAFGQSANVRFLVNENDLNTQLLKNQHYSFYRDINHPPSLRQQLEACDLLLIDSYHISRESLLKIIDIPAICIFIDDNQRINYPKGWVVNGSIYAKILDYPVNEDIEYLLGPEYALLRPEFENLPPHPIRENIENILISFGGSDPRNLSSQVLSCIREQYPDTRVNVIIGKGFRKEAVQEIQNHSNIHCFFHPAPEKIKELMMEADLAISAAGQTIHELSACGTPSILIEVADNQSNNIKGVLEEDMAMVAGNWSSESLMKNLIENIRIIQNPEIRKRLSLNARRLFDGKGPIRLKEKIEREFEQRKSFDNLS